MQIADGEAGPEVYAVATKKDQAKIIWNEAKRMVRKSPALAKRIKTHVADLSSEDYNDGVFKPLSSDSDTLDGLNSSCILTKFTSGRTVSHFTTSWPMGSLHGINH